MSWKLRALILHTLHRAPGGVFLYQLLQARLGRFRDSEYLRIRFRKQRDLAATSLEHGGVVEGATVVEVGTGWVPIVPLGFWICGAREVVSYDLHRFLSPPLVHYVLRWMVEHRDELLALWRDLVPPSELRRRLDELARFRGGVRELLELAGVRYLAPADASATGLEAGSADLHISTNVLEHVPPPAVRAILEEGARVLGPRGLAIHHADPSDHFSHADPAISRIHFLRFEEREWARWSGNRFAYLNRLHDSDYRELLADSGLELRACHAVQDPEVRQLLEDGFPLASPFRRKPFEELSHRHMTYVAAPSARELDRRAEAG
ncbi:MAG: class I SAM-dependent methyltransferase [Holophagales bacterium]|nr:class I SAM-dependent methyltransferase [Holophagales bacterium]